mgnify:FL=1
MKHKLFEAVLTDGAAGGSTAETSTESTPAAPAAGEDFDFAGLASHDDYADPAIVSGEVAAVDTPVPSAAAAPAIPRTETPAAPPVATPPLSPPVEPTPGQLPATATTSAVAATPEPPVPEQLDFAKHREEYLPKLAGLYKMSDQEVEDFRTNPGEALPKLAAQLHYEVQAATLSAVMSSLPSLLEQVMKQQKLADTAEEQFAARWPELKNPSHKEAVMSSIKAFRAANPKADLATTIEKAGLLAMLTLGLNPNAVAPAAPVVPSSPPPRPAGVGAAGHVAPKLPAVGDEENIFAALAEATLSGEI